MQTISATYRVTTPMFLGGGDQQAELRLPSFKGALRFWWRALARERCCDVQQLRQEEAVLFGSSDEDVGQSKILMRLRPHSADVLRPDIEEKHQLKDGGKIVGEGARYFGYGVMEAFASDRKGTKAAQLTRSCLLAPFNFTVELLFKPVVSGEQRNQVEQALKVLGLLGGLGSKSRKGYGSLTLTSLRINWKRDNEGSEDWKPPENPQELVERLGELLDTRQIRAGNADASVFDRLPEWTAFSPASRILVLSPVSQDRTPLALLDRVGREMVRYRSWGRNGTVLGNQPREENFKTDHDLMKTYSSSRMTHPERIIFGLPQNYGDQPNQRVGPRGAGLDRRASPLIVHIHQSDDKSLPTAVCTLLPSRFLPGEPPLIDVGGKSVELGPHLWEPIEKFFDRLLGQEQRKEPFGTAMEVKHG